MFPTAHGLIYTHINPLYFSPVIVKAGAYGVVHLTIIYKSLKYWILNTEAIKIYKIVITKIIGWDRCCFEMKVS